MPRVIKREKPSKGKSAHVPGVPKQIPTTLNPLKVFEAKTGMKDSTDVRLINRALAEQFAQDIRQAIERQTFAHVPLSRGYAKRKEVLGLDPRILIATGAYLRSIQARPTPDGGWAVEPAPEYRKLAQWLEYGTATMPARPHWRTATKLFNSRRMSVLIAYQNRLRRMIRGQG